MITQTINTGICQSRQNSAHLLCIVIIMTILFGRWYRCRGSPWRKIWPI